MTTIPGNGSTAEVLSPGEIVNGTLDFVGDSDWYRVDLTAGLSYGFRISGNGGPGIGAPDPDIYIRNGVGTSVAGGGSNTSTAFVVYNPTSSGTYFVDVTDLGDTGNYQLTWISSDTIQNNTTTTRVLLPGAVITSAIDVPGDSDWFRVSLTAGLSYGFRVAGVGGPGVGAPDPDIYLRDATGTVLVNGGSNISATLIRHNAVSGGTFYVEVTDIVDFGNFQLSWIATDVIQNNITTTNSLARNAQVTSAIDVAGDSDWYRVTLTQGLSYAFQVALSGPNGLPDGDLYLRDAAGNIVVSGGNSSGSVNTIGFTPTVSGVYYIEVTDSVDFGAYILRNLGLDSVVANANTPRTLLEGQRLVGRIDAPGDSDWHRFQAEQGVTYTFRLDGTGALGELASVRLILRDASGNVIGSASGDFGLYTFTATTDGPVFLDVQGRSFGDFGNFILSVVSNAPSVIGTAGNDRILGGGTATVINGLAGNDYMDGGAGNDRLIGDAGNDTMIGGAGIDNLLGGIGNDMLSGGADNDRLQGGAGTDNLRGGTGRDVFVFEAGTGRDVIVDFEDGLDRIQFAGGPRSFAQLVITQVGADVLVRFGTTIAEIDNITRAELSAADFLFI